MKIFCMTLIIAILSVSVLADPPLNSAIEDLSQIIGENDPTTYDFLKVNGIESGRSYDIDDEEVEYKGRAFSAMFTDTRKPVKIIVNAGFTAMKATEYAEAIATALGKIPVGLRSTLKTFVYDGGPSFMADGVLSLTASDAKEIRTEEFEEILLQHLAHLTLNGVVADDPAWAKAQEADGEYVSKEAADSPKELDVAESFLAYVAVRCRGDRLEESTVNKISETIPNRIEYFDNRNVALGPLQISTARSKARRADVNLLAATERPEKKLFGF